MLNAMEQYTVVNQPQANCMQINKIRHFLRDFYELKILNYLANGVSPRILFCVDLERSRNEYGVVGMSCMCV